MQKSTLARLLGIVLILGACVTTWAQTYSNAVMGLNPAGYWPLNETAQPPQVLDLTATNSGSLGAAGDGYYGAWYQPFGNQWYLTNNIVMESGPIAAQDQALNCQFQQGQYIVLPRNTNGVANSALTIKPPFSIECWLNPGTTAGRAGNIVSEGEVQVNAGGTNSTFPFLPGMANANYWAGFTLGQYQNFLYFDCFETNVYNNKGNELDSPKTLIVGQWVYVVCTYNGSQEIIYTNGVKAVSKNIGANGAGQTYVPDLTSPLIIGSGSDVPNNYGTAWTGGLGEVAIYNQALGASQVLAHYQAATSVANYTNTVAVDNPTLYFRMNDGQSQINAGYPSATFPVATNYGTLGTAANGAYQFGTTPGVAGPSYAGFGANSKSVAINGWLGAVDVGNSNLPSSLNPTGAVPLTVVSWFQGGPADAPGRYQEIVGHGDNSYRLGIGQVAAENHFNAGPGPELNYTNQSQVATNGDGLNDGTWHMVAGITDGTNEYLYVDGTLALATNNPAGIKIVGSPTDVLLGGDSQYTYAQFNGVYNTIRNYDGQIAQIAFWTNALTGPQIQSLFNAAGVPPYLYLEPVSSVTANQGQNVTVSTGIRGSDVTYQWYQNGVIVGGQTGANLVLTSAITNNSGSYYVIATSSFGSVTSSVVNVTIYGPPIITQQSLAQLNIFSNSSPTLFVTATGITPAYQWTSNSIAISGATNSTYTISNITQNGTFGCTITNALGTNYASPISITVLADPTAPYPAQVLANGPLAYYRLDEPNGVTTAYDYVGGFNSDYTNTTGFQGEPGYTSQNSVSSDPTETCVYFGAASTENSLAGDVAPFPNFSTPGGKNAEFTVEAWVQELGFSTTSPGNCIAGLGYGNGGEQFVLDTGSTSAGDVRFFVRDAAGNTHGASSTTLINGDGLWHHVVGVCDEAGGHVYLYLDGKLIASGTITAGSGILASTMPMTIGARESSNFNPPNYDFQFDGLIDDVSVYNKALSAAQVLVDYNASGIGPINVQVQPANVSTNQGASVTLIATVQGGTQPLSYQWYDNHNNPVSTATNLVLTDLQTSQSGTYSVTVANTYGSTNVQVSLQVNMGPAQISQDIQPTNVITYATSPVTLSVVATGSLPIYYQWYLGGVGGGVIAGATNSSYNFGALLGTNTYYCVASNNFSYSEGTGAVTSASATVVGEPITTVNAANFNSHLKITFSGYTNSETLQYFPALVRLSTNVTGFNYAEFAGPNGSDLRFADSSGARELPYELDQWNDSNGVSSFWVQVPALSGGTNNSIYAYWGNPSSTTPPAYTTNGAVWEPASFLGLPAYDVVYHLKESAFPFVDSATNYPSLTGVAPTPVQGIVGYGESFNNNYLDAGYVNVGNQFTMSAWVNMSPAANNIVALWANGPGGYYSDELAMFINDYQTSDGALLIGTGDGLGTTAGVNGAQPETATGLVTPSQWHLVTEAVNRTNGAVQFYVDGSPKPIASTGPGGTSVTTDFPTNADMYLGRFITPNFPYTGIMDEARIHGGIDDSNWVQADYMTVANNSTFSVYSGVTNTIALPITLTIRTVGNQAILTWPAGTLQSAGTVNGTYSAVQGVTSPYTNTISGTQQYYRVQIQLP